jgi:cytochrome P450
MTGPEANEMLLLDKTDNFSSRWGWEVVHPFFGRNILVRDFEDHRQHRKLMTHVFKSGALAQYLRQINPLVDDAVDGYLGSVDVYKQTKKLALDIAIHVFAGITSSEELQAWNRELNVVLSNVMAHRIRLPGTKYSQAVAARDSLRSRLAHEINNRRGKRGEDLFSQLVNQCDEKGRGLSDHDVIDHMFGLLFAAHDTTASSLAMIFWLLAKYPLWQQRAREECATLYETRQSNHLEYSDLNALPIIDAIFKETLRMYAPIQFFPRRSVTEFDFQGCVVPANTWILLAPQLTHFDATYYPDPDRFDPGRFLTASNAQKPFTFVPFGKGSHMCLGMNFAYMEIKAVLYRLLLARTLEPHSSQDLHLQYLPIVRPMEEMRVNFSANSFGGLPSD